MSLLPKIIPAISRLALGQTGNFHCLTQTGSTINQASTPLMQIIRTKIRCYFPRPSERKRIKKHGWKKRMSTEFGRRIIMNRILKGRWVLSH